MLWVSKFSPSNLHVKHKCCHWFLIFHVLFSWFLATCAGFWLWLCLICLNLSLSRLILCKPNFIFLITHLLEFFFFLTWQIFIWFTHHLSNFLKGHIWGLCLDFSKLDSVIYHIKSHFMELFIWFISLSTTFLDTRLAVTGWGLGIWEGLFDRCLLWSFDLFLYNLLLLLWLYLILLLLNLWHTHIHSHLVHWLLLLLRLLEVVHLRWWTDSLEVSQIILELLSKHLHHLWHHLGHHLSHETVESLLHHLRIVHHILKHLELLSLGLLIAGVNHPRHRVLSLLVVHIWKVH